MNSRTLIGMGFEFTKEHVRFFGTDRFGEIRVRYAELREKYGDPLTIQTTLRRSAGGLDTGLIRAAAAQCAIAERAQTKTRADGRTLYTGRGLEQASSHSAARFHASLFAGAATILDLCGGIGMDAIAFGRTAERVVTVESDAVTASILRWNLACNNVRAGLVLRGDVRWAAGAIREGAVDAVFADPDRRAAGRRTREVEDYAPPLSFFADRFTTQPLAIKVSPASSVHDPQWRRVFVAVGQECSELLLLRGFDRPSVSVVDAETGETWIPGDTPTLTPAGEEYLIEPHAAIIRSGSVRAYLAEHRALPVDPEIAYGVSGTQPAPSRWHRAYRIVRRLRWNVRDVRTAIRELGLGENTVIKKRGFPLLPEEIRKLFRFTGTRHAAMICTRTEHEHVVFICEETGNSDRLKGG